MCEHHKYGHNIAKQRRRSAAGQPELHRENKHIVQDNIDCCTAQHAGHGTFGILVVAHKCLQKVGQHKKRCSIDDELRIIHDHLDVAFIRSQSIAQWTERQCPRQHEQKRHSDDHQDCG